MPLYLTPYVGSGTHGDPFRPAGIDEPGASAYDIRLDATRADGAGVGFAAMWLPVGIPDPSGAIKIADDYGDLLTDKQRTRLNARLGLDFSGDATIQDALETILFRPNTVRWKQARPGANGKIELWLGSSTGKRRWVDLQVIAGGSITDNFNRANETPIASPWIELSGSTGDVNLSSNTIVKSADGDYFMYYSFAGGWAADQTSQVVVATLGDGDCGPAVRIGADGLSGYVYSNFSTGSIRGAVKIVAGTFSTIEGNYTQATAGQTMKIEVTGANPATIRCYINSTEDALSPASDSSLDVAGNGAGIFWYAASTNVLDDWTGTGELSSSIGVAVDYSLFPKSPISRQYLRGRP